MVIGYKADISKCDEVIADPCGFCEDSNCCENAMLNQFKNNNSEFIFNLDLPNGDNENKS